ncbi:MULTISPECIES: polymorphic toxin type 44 domain-containing protein [Metabacillus]|uniref:polymorphic toxin type 44 domain-containing protein n=3 Tax=Bacillaceae TaxID=186817 RepID=UPI001B96166D|nr:MULTISPECIES: polymorphic toxin type 44 domain-containing protein [Metabacillus]MCM3164702.1 polymorphic toxin type 44 domain-containing protein [Metabacillus litoralis]UGB33618.1 polymorphic toxin type 44 domain-containing protein [Metabacillus sp. B2-18]
MYSKTFNKIAFFSVLVVFIFSISVEAFALTGNGTQVQLRNGHLEVKEAYFYDTSKALINEGQVDDSDIDQFNVTLRIYDHNKLKWAEAGEKVDIVLKNENGTVLFQKTFYTNSAGYVYGHILTSDLPSDFYLDVYIEAKVIKLNGVTSEVIQSPTFSIDLLESEDLLKIINDISTELEEEFPSEKVLTEQEKIELVEIITDQVNVFEADVEQAILEAKESEIKEVELEEIENSVDSSMIQAAVTYDTKTTYTVAKIYQTNLSSANSIKNSYNSFVKSRGLMFANSYRLGMFYNLVKSNGAWDLKRKLGTKNTYKFKGINKTGEYIGNHHYGYMGKAIGFSDTTLKSAAGMYQIKSGTSNWKFISSYFDDPSDQAAITSGYTDYNKGIRFRVLIA